MSENNVADLLAAPDDPYDGNADINKDKQEDARTVKELIEAYLNIRNELRDASAAFKEQEDRLKESLSKISMRLREIGDELGTDTLAVRGLGTAYRNTKVSYRARDWSAFIEWCKQTDNFHCIERRPAKLSVAEIHKSSGEIPPGLDYVAEQEFNVRKA
jgi:hypothetical protein